MIPAQRRARILEVVQRRGVASIAELARSLETSASTVRRDLDYLADNRYLERTYGGAQVAAQPVGTTFEPEYDIGRHTHERAKLAIGRVAAQLVPTGASVLFDSSSTVLEAARALVAAKREITAITNDLNIAMHLSRGTEIRTIVPGGTVRSHSFTLLGGPGTELIERMHVDIALMGAHSLADGVLSDSSLEVVRSKQAMLRASDRCFVLADASKFEARRSFMTIAPLSDVQVLVSDDGLGTEWMRAVEEAGVSLRVAQVDR